MHIFWSFATPLALENLYALLDLLLAVMNDDTKLDYITAALSSDIYSISANVSQGEDVWKPTPDPIEYSSCDTFAASQKH